MKVNATVIVKKKLKLVSINEEKDWGIFKKDRAAVTNHKLLIIDVNVFVLIYCVS
jgi:hypothetical protein